MRMLDIDRDRDVLTDYYFLETGVAHCWPVLTDYYF